MIIAIRHIPTALLILILLVIGSRTARAEDGYDLWLRYRPVEDPAYLAAYHKIISSICVPGDGDTVEAIRQELTLALPRLLGQAVPTRTAPASGTLHMPPGTLVVATLERLRGLGVALPAIDAKALGKDGFAIVPAAGGVLAVTGTTDVAALYGTFHLLRLMQTQAPIDQATTSVPRIALRLLNHWDNLDGSIERGYAGKSLWDWKRLPEVVDPRYRDYARACASIGLNGTALNNVNAKVESLSAPYLHKAAAIAGALRPYGLRVLLTARFDAPMGLGHLPTADPRDPAVVKWWQDKATEIYGIIPDFGGFLVKANSEGQPGPQSYGATHADGANLLADVLAPHGGVVCWRAFVYNDRDPDRANSAYTEFKPMDGTFRSNVILQVKNGPIDFQPREPFHPLFGVMPRTALGLELQITKEYLGQGRHLVYLGPQWHEVLTSDTWTAGQGSTVARVVDGSLDHRAVSCIAGVANIGDQRGWCGNPFNQANWYAFGRLAWDHTLDPAAIAEEWIRATWGNQPAMVRTVGGMMAGSWETCVDYMTPLGLVCLSGTNHDGPQPGLIFAAGKPRRIDWTAQYYHRASRDGIGFDRTGPGGNTSLYHAPLDTRFGSLDTCPENLLLFFHHLPWDHRMHDGRTLLETLRSRYDRGVAGVESLIAAWASVAGQVDGERHQQVGKLLARQLQDAQHWRQTCMEAFAAFKDGTTPGWPENSR